MLYKEFIQAFLCRFLQLDVLIFFLFKPQVWKKKKSADKRTRKGKERGGSFFFFYKRTQRLTHVIATYGVPNKNNALSLSFLQSPFDKHHRALFNAYG